VLVLGGAGTKEIATILHLANDQCVRNVLVRVYHKTGTKTRTDCGATPKPEDGLRASRRNACRPSRERAGQAQSGNVPAADATQ